MQNEQSRLDWADAMRLSSELATVILESDFAADLLVAVARGGWVPTRLLSNELNVKYLASIGVTYSDNDRKELVIYSVPQPIRKGANILLVEDILESGRSLEHCRHHFEASGAVVRTACFYFSDRTIVEPDYSLGRVSIAPALPWETRPGASVD